MQYLIGSYSHSLVVLSIAVAIISAFVALTSVTRIYSSTNWKWDSVWISAFGLSLGTGIWGMHFIAMLAFHLPIPVHYDTTMTLLSLALAVGVCSMAVVPIRSRQEIKPAKAMLFGTGVGSGIAGMHYTGMAAMVMNATMEYAWPIVVLSIVIAIAVSSIAIVLLNYFRSSPILQRLTLKIFAAIIMGVAIASMHYTAMLGVDFIPVEFTRTFSNYIDTYLLAAMVIVIVSLIQGGVFTTALLDESNEMTKKRAEAASALYDVLTVAHGNKNLHEILRRCLDIILNVKWLAVESKGCIFLAGDDGTSLEMVASQNLGEPLLQKCGRVDFGTCLCGKAAKHGTIIHKTEIDHHHEIRPNGMEPHGHYCIPILDKNRTLGVINLYVMHGHRQSPLEVQFLETVSNALASVIMQKQMERILEKKSYEDPLTGIANRRKFADTMDRTVKLAKRSERKFSVLLVDLDLFKPVNDRHGHHVGDALLIEVCRRIETCLRETDLLARIGGDEFAILLEFISDYGFVQKIGDRIIRALQEPFLINNHVLEIGASIGASVFPEHGLTPDELLQQADVALYKAKTKRSEICFAT
ncbi:diguanylate cyclase domain-containing protein [Sedimenticola sp.]|uniref:sensor domain-containing diguanylate cyclase n=1 Tax=Sedimenticola sp. TaxID=1940285 RepID=UPI003D0E73FB